LRRKNQELEDETTKLKAQVKDLKKGDLFSKYAKNVTEENLGTFLTFIFKKEDNPYDNCGVTTASSWFFNLIKYWGQRQLLFKIYDLVGIKYPKWALTCEIPYEWDQNKIDLWFNTLKNHYVCNGAIYECNLGFWQREYQGKTVEQNLNKQYSDVPWNLVLKNPLLLEDNNFDKILKAIKSKNQSSHAQYFTMLPRYQTLTKPQLESFIKVVAKQSNNNKAMSVCISQLPEDSKVWDWLYDNNYLSYGGNKPIRILKKTIKGEPNTPLKLKKMIESNFFTKEEIDVVYKNILK
jgi:hypothetical protein